MAGFRSAAHRQPRRIHWRKWNVIRERMLDRAGHRCEACGKAGKLEVHHRNFLRTDNREENLEVLCRSCHFTIHRQFEEKESSWLDFAEELDA